MESIIRINNDKKINLADFYASIQRGKDCSEFYRKVNLLIGEEKANEYLILEVLGQGRMGFVFLAYHQRKLTALKMSYESQKEEDIFSTVKKTIGDDYQKYFLNPVKKVSSHQVKNYKEWNVLVIIDYWNKMWLPGFFHQPFLDSARFIDNTIFSGVAKEAGDNHREIMKKDIKINNIRESSPESYHNTLEGYTKKLKNGKLKNGTLPYEFQGNKKHHTQLSKK